MFDKSKLFYSTYLFFIIINTIKEKFTYISLNLKIIKKNSNKSDIYKETHGILWGERQKSVVFIHKNCVLFIGKKDLYQVKKGKNVTINQQ
jgi:hypothetical protein